MEGRGGQHSGWMIRAVLWGGRTRGPSSRGDGGGGERCCVGVRVPSLESKLSLEASSCFLAAGKHAVSAASSRVFSVPSGVLDQGSPIWRVLQGATTSQWVSPGPLGNLADLGSNSDSTSRGFLQAGTWDLFVLPPAQDQVSPSSQPPLPAGVTTPVSSSCLIRGGGSGGSQSDND